MISPTTIKTVFLIIRELVILVREIAELWEKEEQKSIQDGSSETKE